MQGAAILRLLPDEDQPEALLQTMRAADAACNHASQGLGAEGLQPQGPPPPGLPGSENASTSRPSLPSMSSARLWAPTGARGGGRRWHLPGAQGLALRQPHPQPEGGSTLGIYRHAEGAPRGAVCRR